MKKKESKGTNPALKSTSDRSLSQGSNQIKAKRKKVSEGSGGARPGAGRKPREYEVKRAEVTMPITLYNEIMQLDINTFSAYMVDLADKDIKRRNKLKGK